MARLTTNYQALLRAYTESPRINSVPMEAEALFIRLLCLSDGCGRYHGDPFTVLARALTTRFKDGLTVEDVSDWLGQLKNAGLITLYSHGGEQFLLVNRYHDAGNRSKTEFPAPPIPDEAPPIPQQGVSGTEATAPTNTITNTNTSNSTITTMSGEESTDCGETVENSAQAEGSPSKDQVAKARESLFKFLVPLGLGHGALPEATEILAGPRWFGSNLTDNTVLDAVKQVSLQARGAASPGGLILSILRREGAEELTAPQTSSVPPQATDGGSGGFVPSTEPEARAAHHVRYAEQLEEEAKTRGPGHPEDAAKLLEKAAQHREAAKRLKVAPAAE